MKSAQPPGEQGNRQPYQPGPLEARRGVPAGQQNHNAAAKQAKATQPKAAPRASSAAALRPRPLSIMPGLSLIFRFMLLHQRGACRENRRKSEEQTAENRAVVFRDQTRCHGDGAAKKEAQRIFVPSRPPRAPRCQTQSAWIITSGSMNPAADRAGEPQTSAKIVTVAAPPPLCQHAHAHAAIDEKRDRAHNHRSCFQSRINLSVGEIVSVNVRARPMVRRRTIRRNSWV